VTALVTGAGGQLGSEFARLLALRGDCLAFGHDRLDVTDGESVDRLLTTHRPELVIHCAAWTDVDGCERDPDRAYRTNAEGTRLVAQAAARIGAKLVYISTDFVFDGSKPQPYNEDDAPNPINVYGASKLAGEEHVRRLCAKHYIVRTAWLFGPSANNFVGRIIKAAIERRELRVADDQVGSPTSVCDLAARVVQMIGRAPFGIYHVTNGGFASRYRWACEITGLAGLDVRVTPIAASEWPAPARRPANSRLDNKALREAGFPPMRPYQEALAQVVPNVLKAVSGR
jgi:dTDP-4-dehydrorhamnose reductase